jgi:hypothetical protein
MVRSCSLFDLSISGGADCPASLHHLATDVSVLARLWRTGESMGSSAQALALPCRGSGGSKEVRPPIGQEGKGGADLGNLCRV